MTKGSITFIAPALLVFAALAEPAAAGKGAFRPTYTPPPCTGDECRADDPKSGTSCQGFLCGFVPAKAMQPPVTAAQAAELERARAAAEAQAAAQAAPATAPKAETTSPKKKRVAKAKPAKPATTATATPPASAVPPGDVPPASK